MSLHPLPSLLTAIPLIPFTTEEVTGCTTKTAKGVNKEPRNLLACFFFFFLFQLLLLQLLNQLIPLEFSSDFMILIILFVSSTEVNRVNPVSAPTASFSLMSLSEFFIAFEAILLTNPGKLSLVKVISTFLSAILPKLPNQEPKDPLDLFILDI